MTKIPAAKDPTRNVWLQLGFPDAEEHYLKAELVLRLDKAIRSLGLTQRVAARRIGTTQPELSKILGGKFTEVSLERLMRFLTALGYHIEIKIGAGQTNKAGDVASKPDLHPDGDRWHTIGLVGSVLLLVIHTWPEAESEAGELVGRIISARKATAHERKAYEEGNF